MKGSSLKSLTTKEVLISDDIREDETEESNGGDDNNNDETLPVEAAGGLLLELAISCFADADNDEPYRYTAFLSV